MTIVSIECLLKRQGGTKESIDDAEYHFKPATGKHADPHTADVENREHVAMFLRIPEAYALAGDFAVAPVRDLTGADLPKLDEFATLSDGAIADQFTQAFGSAPPKGFTRDLMIAAIKVAPAQTAAEPKPAAKAKKAAKAAVAPVETVTPPASGYDALDDDALLSEYIEVFGAEPSAEMDRETIIAALNAVPKE